MTRLHVSWGMVTGLFLLVQLPTQAASGPVLAVTDVMPESQQNASAMVVNGKTVDNRQTYSGSSQAQVLSPVTVLGDAESEEVPWRSTATRSELDRMQVQSWDSFAQRVDAGVNFSAADGSVNIRGLDKNRVLTTVDGIRQSWLSDIRHGYGPSARGGLNTLDFNTFATIGVLRGADSARLGSGAMAGAVEVRTLEPEDLLAKSQDPGRSWTMLGKTGYQSVDGSGYVSTALAGRRDSGFSWLLQVGRQFGHARQNAGMQGGYGIERSEVNPDDFSAQSYMLKLRQKFEGGHQLGLSGNYFERQDNQVEMGARSDIHVPGTSFSQEVAGRQSVALDYQWTPPSQAEWVDALALKLYWQKVDLSLADQSERIKQYGKPRGRPGPVQLQYPFGAYAAKNSLQELSYGISGSASKTIQGDVSQRWEMGVQWYGTQLQQYAQAKNNCPAPAHLTCPFIKANQADMPRSRGSQWGVWLQNTLRFAEGVFELTPAIRYDFYRVQPQHDTSFQSNLAAIDLPDASGAAWSPKLMARWNISPAWSVYGQYAKGFTAPTATQLFSRYGSPQTYLFHGNPNLKAETSHGWEFGLRYQDSRSNASLTYFDTHYSNFIQKVQLEDRASGGRRLYPMGVNSFENRANVRIYGIETKGYWQLSPAWSMHASTAWSVGKDQDAGTYLNSVPPLTAIFGVNYEQDQWGLGLQWRVAAARSRVQTPVATSPKKGADFKAPGYGVMDLTAHWTPSEVKGLTIEAGIYNVFNKTYWNALEIPAATVGLNSARPVDLYTQPGVNFAVSLSYQY